MKQKIISIVKILGVSLVLVGIISVSADTWPKPASTATNTATPINESATIQAKSGALVVGSMNTTYPRLGSMLDIPTSLITSGLVSNSGISITGNLDVQQNIAIAGLSATTTKQPICADPTGVIVICPTVPVPSGQWLRDSHTAGVIGTTAGVADTYYFNTATDLPPGVTSYTIEIWGPGGGGDDATKHTTLTQVSCGGISGDVCTTPTSIVGGTVNMVAKGGDVGRDGGYGAPEVPPVTADSSASGGTINAYGISGGMYAGVTASPWNYCKGGTGGRAYPNQTTNTITNPTGSLGGIGGAGGTPSGPYTNTESFAGLNGSNYGGGGGGVSRASTTLSPCNTISNKSVGGAGGGYSYKSVVNNPSSPVTYTVKVGRPGKRGAGGQGGKGAVLIKW